MDSPDLALKYGWFASRPYVVDLQLNMLVSKGGGNKSFDISICRRYISYKFATYTNIFEMGARK
jgi:hypothetical protein